MQYVDIYIYIYLHIYVYIHVLRVLYLLLLDFGGDWNPFEQTHTVRNPVFICIYIYVYVCLIYLVDLG